MLRIQHAIPSVIAGIKQQTTSFAVAERLQKRALVIKQIMLESLIKQLLKMMRTGRMGQGAFSEIVQGDHAFAVMTGVDPQKVPYARIQDVGGIVRAKRAKYLTIPVGANLDARRVGIVSAPDFIANPGTLGFVGSFVNRQQTAIMGKRADKSIEPVFALKKSVRIPAQHYIKATKADASFSVRQQLRAMAKDVRDDVARAVREANHGAPE